MTVLAENYQSKGLRNDRGRKFIDSDYVYDIQNMNYDEIVGYKSIKYPSVEYNIGATKIDGGYDFTYIDANGQFQSEHIIVQGSSIIKNWQTTPTTIYTGLTAGNKCTFGILNDKLFISNGVDYPLVYDGTTVREMGAPTAQDLNVAGSLTGTYYYALTYVINSVEVIIGTVSNTLSVTGKSIDLILPVGVSNVTERRIYRTEAGGSTLKLLHAIHDNTTTTYQDNKADNTLGSTIPTVNSPCPKPQFITVKDERLIGCGESSRPNYLYVSEFEIEIFFRNFGAYDVSGVGNDNTKLTGLVVDYNQIVVFSEKQIYLADTSGITASIRQTNSNVGCIDGFSIARVPENDVLTGGIMFVSNLYDVRVFSGNIATNLATQLDNLRTNNFSIGLNQIDFELEIKNNPIDAFFYDYKYHLIGNSVIYVYDIRIAGWTLYKIKTATYTPTYWRLFQIGNDLYITQKDAGIVEKMYQDLTYRSEVVESYIETPEISVGTEKKFLHKLYVYFDNIGSATVSTTVTIDNNRVINTNFSFDGGYYDPEYYDPEYYQTTDDEQDYKVININRYGQWMRVKLSTTDQSKIKGWKLVGRVI